VSDPLTIHRAFYDAVETGDVDLMASLWVDDPDVSCVHPGAVPLRGTSQVLRSWTVLMANVGYIQFFLTDVEVGLHGDVASVTCTENVLTGDERAGTELFGGGSAVATNVFVRTPDGWRLWLHHTAPVVSPGGVDDA
jgi:ketosteroid isomerase-like protein